MGSLRELLVSIDFDNVDTAILDRIEQSVDDIEDALEAMGNELDEVMGKFAEIATAGSAAFNEISSEAHSAASAIDEIGDEAQGAAAGLTEMGAAGDGVLDEVESQADQTSRALDEVGDQAGEASAEMAAAGATGSAAMGELERAAQAAAREVDDVGDEAQGAALKIGLMATALVGLTALGTAAMAPLVAGVMGLAASFGAAGIGAAAYGAVAVSVLGQVFESASQVDQIQQKIDSADSTKERIAAEKELAALYDGMSQSQQGALQQLQQFKAFWGEFTQQFENPIFDAFNQGLKVTQSLLTGLAPTIGNVSAVFTQLLEELNGFIGGGGLNGFFEWLSTTASSSLYNWAHIFGNVFNGIFGLLQAFTPLGKEMEQGLVGITEKFAAWGQSLSSNDSFKSFIEYVKTNGPVLWDILGNVADIIGDIVKAAAPLGEVLLQALQGITEKLSEMSPGLEDIVESAMEFGSVIADNWEPIAAIVTGIATAIGIWKIATLAQTIAMWALNTALFANPLFWVAAAIGAVIAIGILLWQNWDTIKQKATELWATITEAWSSLVEWTKETWNSITTAISEAWDAAIEWVVTGAQSMWEGITTWWNNLVTATTEIWNMIVLTVQALWSNFVSWVITKATEIWMGLTNIWNLVVTTASELWNMLVTAISTIFSTLWSFIVTVATNIWNSIVMIFTAIWTTAVTIWTAISTAITTIFSAIWNIIVTVATAIWTTITTVFNNILSTAIAIWSAVSSAIQTFFTAAWNIVVSIATAIWNTIVTWFNQVLSTATSIWTAVTTAIDSAFQAAVDIVVGIATNIWNAITETFDNVLSKTQDIWDSVKSAISDAMNDAADAVSNFFDPLLGFIDSAKGAWDGFVGKITSFKMPKIDFPSLPSWMGGGGADGSHATGLAQVPFDGYCIAA